MSASSEDLHKLQESVLQLLEVFQDRVHDVNSRGEELRAALNAIDRLVRGDGSEGLVSKVNSLNEKLGFLDNQIRELRQHSNKILWWVIGCLTTGLGAMVMTFIISKLASK